MGGYAASCSSAPYIPGYQRLNVSRNSSLEYYDGQWQFPLLPAHCGHHLNPIAGFWRVMKDAIGAGWYFPDLHQLYHRTRRVLMAHQERPIYEFHW